MEQRIYIARHAHSVDGSPDETRPLSNKGFKQMGRLCKPLRRNQLIQVDEIWQSGLLRATETAQCLCDGLELNLPIKTVKDLRPYDHPKTIVDAIEKTEKSLLIVGHEPNLSALSSLLIAGDTESQKIVFNKASILCLTRLRVGKQSTPWEIQWHLWHKLLKA